MDKRIVGLLGAVAAVGALSTTAQASQAPNPSEAFKASPYADLLEPIANAGNILQSLDQQAPAKSMEGRVRLAGGFHHHHHHPAFGIAAEPPLMYGGVGECALRRSDFNS